MRLRLGVGGCPCCSGHEATVQRATTLRAWLVPVPAAPPILVLAESCTYLFIVLRVRTIVTVYTTPVYVTSRSLLSAARRTLASPSNPSF